MTQDEHTGATERREEHSPTADRPRVQDPATAPILTGPSPMTVLVGLIGLLVAGGVGLTTVTDLRLDINWTYAGPAVVIGTGLLIVVLGLLGMRAQRRT